MFGMGVAERPMRGVLRGRPYTTCAKQKMCLWTDHVGVAVGIALDRNHAAPALMGGADSAQWSCCTVNMDDQS